MDQDQLREFFKSLNGKIFGVSFVKKNGELREMVARLGVKSHLKGGELPFDPVAKGLLPVFDMQKQAYRMVNLSSIKSIKANGILYEFN